MNSTLTARRHRRPRPSHRLGYHLRTFVGVGAVLTVGLTAQAAAADDGSPPVQIAPRDDTPSVSVPITLQPAPQPTLPPGVTVAPQQTPTLPPGVTVAPQPTPTLPPGVTLVPEPPITLPGVTVAPLPPISVPGGQPTNPEGATTEPGTPAGETTAPPAPAGGEDSVAADDDGGHQPWAPEELSIDIALAQVLCDGTIHVEFGTAAAPDPGWPASHVVMVHPVDDPAEIDAVQSSGRPANGAFVIDQPGVVTETYRVLVVARFDPENADGAKAIDEAETVAATDC